MNILTEIIVLVASTLILGQIPEYDYLPNIQERTLPPELQFLEPNKTDEELLFEDCMKSYSLCMAFQRNRGAHDTGICALDKKTLNKASFSTFCEMAYENCKDEEEVSWGYFHDGPCTVEFVGLEE